MFTNKLPPPLVSAGLSGALAVAASLIGYFEGRSLVAYLDPVGIPTICEGVTRGVRLGQIASEQECDARLADEVRRAAGIVDRNVKVVLTPSGYAAWVSFVYNVGEGNFTRSTALKKLNAKDTAGACNEMLRWVYAGGRKLGGLVRRRQAERNLCLQ